MFAAYVEGWRRVLRSPVLVISILAALFLVSLPLAVRPGELIGPDLEATLRSALLLVNTAWAAEWPGPQDSVAVAIFHTLVGFGRTLAGPFLLFWLFLPGGILDRVARNRPIGTAQFFASCGVYLMRFVRLGVAVAAAYYLLFRLFRPQTSTRLGFFAFLSCLAVVNLVVDFAKVRAVLEDRRSMLSATLASLRFIRTRLAGTVGLFALHVLTGAALMLAWARLAPVSADPLKAFALGQVYLLAIVTSRLAFMASEVAYFQRELAHASYTASPELIWPDSPAVEAIQNLTNKKEPGREGAEAYGEREGSTW